MAERFAREGMKIVLADVEENALAQARDALAKGGAEALAVRTDVAKAEEVDQLARRATEAFGAVHVLCNNAGVGVGGPAWELTPADWEWILGVNLRGVVHGIRAFVPGMVARGEGHVVNTASIAGLISAPGMSAYSATKHAVVAITECLHHDLTLSTGGKVKASVLCPAWVKTNIAESDRNRPAALRDANAPPPTPQALMMHEWTRAAIAGGIPPEAVAEKVLEAVREGSFWILTHQKTKATVEKRMRGILEGTAPQFDPNAA
jgi:NAD(P)-dependent dehydrogenase (short-subunit alcohol dehydrogenase family)